MSTSEVRSYWFLRSITFFFFFFFQAEDGIRDLTVTGVQTCALPISDVNEMLKEGGLCLGARAGTYRLRGMMSVGEIGLSLILLVGAGLLVRSFLRSEERRVGKECRSRWSPYH